MERAQAPVQSDRVWRQVLEEAVHERHLEGRWALTPEWAPGQGVGVTGRAYPGCPGGEV